MLTVKPIFSIYIG